MYLDRVRKSVLTSGFLASVVALISGCGYHFAASGSGLPAQAQTIYVGNFGNRTRFTGVNDEFMRYLKDEIADHKRLALADSPGSADLLLSGDIMYYDVQPGAFNAVSEPILYEEALSANATLTDAHTHAVIWSSRGISAAAQAPSVAAAVITTSPHFLQQNLRAQDIARLPDIQLAQTQRSAAQGQMMEQLAQNLYAAMSEGF
jgi:hypothetical protein